MREKMAMKTDSRTATASRVKCAVMLLPGIIIVHGQVKNLLG